MFDISRLGLSDVSPAITVDNHRRRPLSAQYKGLPPGDLYISRIARSSNCLEFSVIGEDNNRNVTPQSH